MKRALWLIALLILMSAFSAADTVPSSEDLSCQNKLSQCEFNLQNKSNRIDTLREALANMTEQRNRYRELYRNSSLSNFTVRKYNDLEDNLTVIQNKYDQTFNKIEAVSNTVNQVWVLNIVLVVALSISLIGSIWGFSIWEWNGLGLSGSTEQDEDR